MVEKHKKIKFVGARVPYFVYEQFVKKIRSEGWTLQEALRNLMIVYIDGKFNIKGNK